MGKYESLAKEIVKNVGGKIRRFQKRKGHSEKEEEVVRRVPALRQGYPRR